MITNNTFISIGEVLYEVLSHSNNLTVGSDQIEVFPNPAKTTISIVLKQASTQTNSVSIYSVEGQLIRQVSFSENQLNLDIGQLPKGLYLLQVEQDQKSLGTQKLIIH